MQTTLFVLGLVLFLLGMLTGLAVPASKNPRMGVASHLEGVMNGPFLIVVGLLWPYLDLAHGWRLAVVILLAYGTYAYWLATQLGALWGAGGKYAPIATGEHVASPTKENVINVLLVSLTPAMIVGCVILVVGVV
ncbi:hydrogenase [Gordonia sp. (in: high G+C Gram-positive bacteria)]|uniref:hydrogenase n=1 Tax=Gordonia sp. (in: high G+C Gram-positive bacteria) TaxID=84139 RepID=UPI0016A41772|nr:hydrogenase [Gordonia sp. (in: high G+C Gram-positive bacteria)]NLG45324.1 hydrogenase [Gordonia sp. (in: high G+C Gram-positive bacteria)]